MAENGAIISFWSSSYNSLFLSLTRRREMPDAILYLPELESISGSTHISGRLQNTSRYQSSVDDSDDSSSPMDVDGRESGAN